MTNEQAAALSLFAVAAPGLEPITAQELERLGLGGEPMPGGVAFSADAAGLYRANLWLRTASRVLVRVGEFYAAAFSELRKKAGRLPWEAYLQPGQPVAIKATCHKSRLYHSDAVAERVAGAIGDRLGTPTDHAPGHEEAEPPLEGETRQLVVVRLVRDLCTISLDASGALLHQRGYRLATAKAPLRETLAAGLLLASGWDPTTPLLDPFCGSGTIVIEAALLASNAAPGLNRNFTFEGWPNHDAAAWQALKAEALAARRAPDGVVAFGSDRDAGAIEAAQANAERAGVSDVVRFEHCAVSAVQAPPGPGWVVTNPPYGVRLPPARDLRDLYARFGQVLRAQCPGWRVALLAGNTALAYGTGLPFDPGRSLHLVNGGLRVTLLQGRVPRRKDEG